MDAHGELDALALIRPEERDFNLRLHSTRWGAGLSGWRAHRQPARHLRRVLPVHADGGKVTKLHEFIVPFPSAAIYGINRKAEYGMSLPERPNMHTVRVLRRANQKPIHRLFILHNGLNETDSLKFYYRLADWILSQQEALSEREGAACLIMPFPGHLMHASFHGPFSETPLSRYLADAGDLFRQFLRYMVGMRWLLSMVADSDAERWMVGGDLLTKNSRISEIYGESKCLHEMSERRLTVAKKTLETHTGAAHEPTQIGRITTKRQIEDVDDVLRSVLTRECSDAPPSLRIHVVGYSLGGFMAQSVFFAWPQVISSCTTICSGGALSALSPTAFAQPEEWQSVLHALRPELSNSMLQGRLGDDERKKDAPVARVAGMPIQRFGYFQRIFEQVFLQEDRRTYQERLSEYGLRMLFISGGEDPIVPPANVLDASPKEGTTMLTVAGMTHFLDKEPRVERGQREKEQRDFWLPEAGRLIARAAIHSEDVHADERKMAKKLRSTRPTAYVGEDAAPRSSRASKLLTSSDLLETALDWVLEAIGDDDGWLIVCRNMLPTAFIGTRNFMRWGMALHHHDVRVQQYALGLRRRARMLRELNERTTLVLPHQLHHWFVDLSARFDPNSDAPAGGMTTRSDRDRIWRSFEKRWWSVVQLFNAGNVNSACNNALDAGGLSKAIADWQEVDQEFIAVTHLPDVWIGIKGGATLISAKARRRTDAHREVLEGVERVIQDEVRRENHGAHGNTRPRSARGQATPREQLESDLANELIRVVQVSAAEFNPRYRGRIETSPTTVARQLAWCAAALVRSTPMEEPTV